MDKEVLTDKDICLLFNVGSHKLKQLRDNGFPFVEVCGIRFYLYKSLINYLKCLERNRPIEQPPKEEVKPRLAFG